MKKLYRSRKGKMLAGVCAGLGEYFDIDPTIVRLGFAFLTLFGILPGLVLYLIAWVIVPEKQD